MPIPDLHLSDETRGANAALEAIMRTWLRRIRGAFGMGVTWGAVWSAAGFLLAVVTRFRADAPFPLIFGVLGFAAGVMFSVFLALAEGRRGFSQMSLPRFAGWGGAAGLLLGAIFSRAASLEWGDVLAIVPAFALASAVCASGSLALARRAVLHALPHRTRDVATAELPAQEKQQLH